MKKSYRIVSIILTLMILGIPILHSKEIKADVMPPEELSFTPVVFGEITSETQKVIVFSYGDEFVPTTLKVSNGKQTIFKKTYKKSAVRLIEIPRQKPGTCLQFSLKTSYGKKGGIVNRTVKNAGTVSKKKVSSVFKPKVSGKITDKSTSVKVYAKKGTTLYVKHGSLTLAKKKYKKSGYQSLSIKRQKAGEVITFFAENKKGRSKYVEKVVSDVTAPAKPKVEVAGYDIRVTGEVGTGVYIKDVTGDDMRDNWIFMGVLDKKVEFFTPYMYYLLDEPWNDGPYQVRLVDAWGNKSKIVTVNIPNKGAEVSD
ncbi:hypothetical protein [Roseburia sp. 1XD42-69]|uniref:hypothetical protein n=1 Tax=Roseburia sp. 1XD42-69 TaxID=2320088 RepID=UPI000E9FFC8D|nr:hypothetical protein [Roseburia sp. 1XD42-69]RKJ60045.1 hypothetical protein D7Y06_24940 [Roseburia sp. 1XD42-69]